MRKYEFVPTGEKYTEQYRANGVVHLTRDLDPFCSIDIAERGMPAQEQTEERPYRPRVYGLLEWFEPLKA